MKKRLIKAAVAATAVFALAGPASAISFQTLFQFSSDGTGNGTTNGVTNPGYDLVGLNQLDWQAGTGNLLIEQAIDPTKNSEGASTLAAFFATATANDTLSFNIHAQATLGQFLKPTGGAGNGRLILDTNGAVGGDAGYEVTVAIDATESAKVLSPGIIQFTSMDGTLKLYYDATPDMTPGAGTGFNDGTNFLTAHLTSSSGLFGATLPSNNVTIGGAITSYDSAYIQTDPTAAAPLLGTELVSTIQVFNATDIPLTVPGGQIGIAPYIAKAVDITYAADANQPFSAVPEPGTMILLGSGLIGVAGLGRRRMKK